MKLESDLGAVPRGGDSCRFVVWAPAISQVEVHSPERISKRDGVDMATARETSPPASSSFFAQNHDQVENPLKGDLLSALVSFEGLKLAAAVVLLSSFIPLLFMGEECEESSQFPYFVSHSDAALIEAVRRGRREESAWLREADEPPDPLEEATRRSANLDHGLRHREKHGILYGLYKELIKLRNETRGCAGLSKDRMEVVCLEGRAPWLFGAGTTRSRSRPSFILAISPCPSTFPCQRDVG